MIFTSLSPNTERDDIWLALKLLVQPWKWKRGDATGELEGVFKKYLGTKHAFAVNNGRTALFALLKAYGIGKGDEVLLQAYTCVAVPEPVLWVGAKPIFVDCDASLTMKPEDFKNKITSKSKAVIIQHTFGCPANLEEILKIAKEKNLIVIEDCAHALGAEYKNKKVGTFGDASFFSFGRDKVLSSVFGGMIATDDDKLQEKLEKIIAAFKYSSRLWTVKQLLHPIILAKAKLLYGVLSIGKIILAVSRVLGLISLAVEKNELSGGKPSFSPKLMPNALALLALNQLKKVERYNSHRKKIAGLYEKEFSHLDRQRIYKDADSIFLRFTLFVEVPRNLFLYAKKRGIELGNWYTEPIAPKGVAYEKVGYAGNCKEAEYLAARSINLPTSIQTSEKKARRVISVVKEYLDGSTGDNQ